MDLRNFEKSSKVVLFLNTFWWNLRTTYMLGRSGKKFVNAGFRVGLEG